MATTTKQPHDIALLPLGANLHTFTVASTPLVLSLPTQSAYTTTGNPAYFGETIGRVANRIKAAQLLLNGQTYPLAANNGPNTLHGGPRGWGKQLWTGPLAEDRNGREAVRFELTSGDGDEGFPGTVHARAWYIGYEDAEGKTCLEVEYEVVFPEEQPKGSKGEVVQETVVSVTNHTAFSIGPVLEGGRRSIAGTKVVLETADRQVLDGENIPTGEVAGHPLVEVGREIELGKTEPMFDDCFVVEKNAASVPLDTRGGELRKLVGFSNGETGIRFEAWSTEPAFQFYTGEYIDLDYTDPQTGKRHVFEKRAGFCVEASRYVDAASRKEWEGMVKMKRGDVWGSRTVYKAWKA